MEEEEGTESGESAALEEIPQNRDAVRALPEEFRSDEELPMAELVDSPVTRNAPEVGRSQVEGRSADPGTGNVVTKALGEIFGFFVESFPTLLVGLIFLLLFGVFTVQGFYSWWFYLGWLGGLVMVVLTVSGLVCSFRAFLELEYDSIGCSLLFYLVLSASVVIKAPRLLAILAWEQFHLQIGGHDWVNDPAFGPHQGIWTGSSGGFF